MVDVRGIRRGKCKLDLCSCDGFTNEGGMHCAKCHHSPGKHFNLDKESGTATTPLTQALDHLRSPSIQDVEEVQELSTMCALHPRCTNSAYFDANTGESSLYCDEHRDRPDGGFHSESLYSVQYSTCKYPGCSKPCYVDDGGTVFDCCNKKHGRLFLELKQQQLMQSGQVEISSDSKCNSPWCDRPKFQENGKVYDFCGQTCRNNFYKNRQSAGPMKHCSIPGCKQSQSFNATISPFCGSPHQLQAQKLVLFELGQGHKHYINTVSYFTKQWNPRKSSPPTAAEIISVFKILSPAHKAVFTKYSKSLSSSTEKYFHGTSIKCDLANNKAACTDGKCGVCGISRNGFDMKLIGSNIPRFMRFGKGFYLAPNSSKCHDYTQGFANHRVLLLCKVAPGHKYTVKNDQTTLTAPPQGYDSVYGASGGSLNYDEIVLYRSESVLPKYAIVYRRDGVGKIAK